MQRFTSLETVEERVWQRLTAAATEPGHPYRTLAFGTVKSTRPRLRTVVLRGADTGDRRLAFHTDRRSEKVEEIGENDEIAWLAWDPESREQVRLWGTASVHVDDETAQSMWESEDPSSLRVYLQQSAPGKEVEAPTEDTSASNLVESKDIEEGWPYFAVVRTQIRGFDWLHLHPDGHYRARYEYSAADETFEGAWIAP